MCLTPDRRARALQPAASDATTADQPLRFSIEMHRAMSSDCEGCDELGCANHPDLRGRRILCVGGRARPIEQ